MVLVLQKGDIPTKTNQMADRSFLFLHIGKTGGTALRAVLEQHAARSGQDSMRKLPHKFTLHRVIYEFPEAQIGLFVRDPVQRFVSGFLSRRRCGRPRYNSTWSVEETRAFTMFPTPTQLGEALARRDPEAICAVAAIQHTRRNLAHYLHDVSTLERFRGRIGFIGRLDRLERRYGLAQTQAEY